VWSGCDIENLLNLFVHYLKTSYHDSPVPHLTSGTRCVPQAFRGIFRKEESNCSRLCVVAQWIVVAMSKGENVRGESCPKIGKQERWGGGHSTFSLMTKEGLSNSNGTRIQPSTVKGHRTNKKKVMKNLPNASHMALKKLWSSRSPQDIQPQHTHQPPTPPNNQTTQKIKLMTVPKNIRAMISAFEQTEPRNYDVYPQPRSANNQLCHTLP
jgi:hypothetical protein